MNKTVDFDELKKAGIKLAQIENDVITTKLKELIELGRLTWEDVAFWNLENWMVHYMPGGPNTNERKVYVYKGRQMFTYSMGVVYD